MPTAGTRRWQHLRASGVILSALLVTACAGTSNQQVAVKAETTVPSETTTTTTTPPDCAATLPTTALASQLLMVMVSDPSQAADSLSGGLVGGFGLKGDNLQRHELLQKAWLKHNGAPKSAFNDNPGIKLPDKVHDPITAEQRAAGLHEPEVLKGMPAEANIQLNYEIAVKNGVPEPVARAAAEQALEVGARVPCP